MQARVGVQTVDAGAEGPNAFSGRVRMRIIDVEALHLPLPLLLTLTHYKRRSAAPSRCFGILSAPRPSPSCWRVPCSAA